MRWLAKGKSKLFREKTGFTLIEIVIALGILAAVGTGFLTALNTNSRAVRTVDEQVTATNLATAYFEAISKSTYATEPPYYDEAVASIDIPFQYNVAVNVESSSDGTNFNAFTVGETLQRITVIVSRQGKPVLSTCTYKAEK